MQQQNIDLETFLESLPAEAAANARAAAARIDDLERAALRIGTADRQYILLFAGAGILALIAAAMTLGGYPLFTTGYGTWGNLVVLAMAGALPLLIVFYSLRMRERTRLDQKIFELIETYFMPYNGIYFPPAPGHETGTISIGSEGSWRHADKEGVKKARMYW